MSNISQILGITNQIHKANSPHVRNQYIGYEELKEGQLSLSQASTQRQSVPVTPNPFSKDPLTPNDIAQLLYSFELEKINAEKKTVDGMNPRTK